ncbi:MAG: LysM peptidoglycan-binding domain-containing protein, partial [Frankiaceae bacterium]
MVLILLTTCLVAVAFGAGRASATPARPAGLSTVVVQRGDTLWSIAARIAGDGDIRETVEQITALNGVAAQ